MQARYLLSMENKNDYNFWNRAIAGVPTNANQTEFANDAEWEWRNRQIEDRADMLAEMSSD